ncbi:MAG TPA: ATP-binding cassette domain-containing protein, partial [Burkholderiaceae bacterium]|nr:ATP-binding cassette domain-containing protein [Burkholderiaceae bacterium]
SGGEKARLVLAMLVWQRPNLLLLDEPTNHLDLQTREALSMALNEFEGTVMLVSHDRALLREVCDEFWLVAKGQVLPFDGDLDDYQRWLLETAREAAKAVKEASRSAAEAQKSSSAAAPASQREDRKASAQARAKLNEQTRPLRKEIESIDKQLAKLAQERESLESELATGTLAPAAIAESGRRLKAVGDEIDELEMRWLELSEQIESLTAVAGL